MLCGTQRGGSSGGTESERLTGSGVSCVNAATSEKGLKRVEMRILDELEVLRWTTGGCMMVRWNREVVEVVGLATKGKDMMVSRRSGGKIWVLLSASTICDENSGALLLVSTTFDNWSGVS